MRTIAMLFLATLTLALSAAPRTPEQEVRAVLVEWLDALEHNDLARLERIIAPDYRITASAEARVMDRTEDLAPIASGDLKFESAEASEVDVRVFGNTAVVTGVGKFSVVMRGKTMGKNMPDSSAPKPHNALYEQPQIRLAEHLAGSDCLLRES